MASEKYTPVADEKHTPVAPSPQGAQLEPKPPREAPSAPTQENPAAAKSKPQPRVMLEPGSCSLGRNGGVLKQFAFGLTHSRRLLYRVRQAGEAWERVDYTVPLT